jgi:putative phosphoribosyl transferase
MGPRFQDRIDGGKYLARKLRTYAGDPTVLVLALPRGGVPVGFEVAKALHTPLSVFIVRKLGAPGHEELAMGAIASGGTRVINEEVVRRLNITPAQIDQAAERESAELCRREQLYLGDSGGPCVAGKRVILVDDGLATGATMRAAVLALRQQNPALICVAAPVGARETCEKLKSEADDVVCAEMPEPFYAIGTWYADFLQTTDAEVREYLRKACTEFSKDAPK